VKGRLVHYHVWTDFDPETGEEAECSYVGDRDCCPGPHADDPPGKKNLPSPKPVVH
jgi:hypothetical protein